MRPVARTARTLRRILRTRYPAFLFGMPLRRGEIPIFTYHDVEAMEFAQDLTFLQLNGYRTLSLGEFLDQGGRAREAREVLLTFDDARASVVRIALPMLVEFEARAVLFVPTYWIREVNEPALPIGSLFMSWSEIRKCRDSGVFAIESHAHRHALVHTSPRLVGFADPRALARYDIYDWPMRDAGDRCRLGFPPLGTPVYEAAPLLCAERCYIESSEVSQACVDFVARAGAEAFFRRPDALEELRQIHNRRSARCRGRVMGCAALDTLIQSEFELSRDAFVRHLGIAPRAFAYPWMLGNARSLDCARDSGISAAFGTAGNFRRAKDSGLPVKVFGRLKADWLRLLPGQRRASFRKTISRKISGFASNRTLAH